MPDVYCEPLFDNNESGEYSEVRDEAMILCQQKGVSNGDYEPNRAFIQPATCLNLLFDQIKETVIMEILPESIRYAVGVYVRLCMH